LPEKPNFCVTPFLKTVTYESKLLDFQKGQALKLNSSIQALEKNYFCINYNIETSFVSSLQQTGFIEITIINDNAFIDDEQLRILERLVCFYYELNINIEGIETITHLLQQMNKMHDEIIVFQNKFRLYE
jgi:chaperone modulatory protein CbpM